MRRKLIRMLVALTCFLIVNMVQGIPTTVVKVSGQPKVPYDLGNWTYITKPVYPVKVNASQISIGADWTYVCMLKAGSLYHVYFYGDWIDYDALTNKTDYDIYVYNPFGKQESLHTESAGLPEHLGTTVDEPFFTPEHSGDYSFRIVNDPKESRDAKNGTFMLIEHLECNHWHTLYLVGKVDDKPVESTSGAYEFMTSSRRVEVWVEVPDTLDMYEVQLYLMANPSQGMGALLNGVPIAWEPGLYRETDPSGLYGGYSLDSEGLRHFNLSDSCEYPGQDMLINFTLPGADAQDNQTSPPAADVFLYHLGLIAENGKGVVRFMFKTDFEAPSLSILNPVERACSSNGTTIAAYVRDEGSGLDEVSLNYTRDDWETWYVLKMSPSLNHTYLAMVPGQPAGSMVKYRIAASDIAGNIAEKEGGYTVKDSTEITFSLSQPVLYGDESIRVTGLISAGQATVTLNYTCQDLHVLRQIPASYIGSFVDEYTPARTGDWNVSASWPGDEKHFEASSGHESFTVEKISTSVSCVAGAETITIGDQISIRGYAEPPSPSRAVSLAFTKPDGTKTEQYVYTSSDGSFNLIITPDLSGSWTVQATLVGDEFHQPAYSVPSSFSVNDTWINQYRWYIIGGAGIGIAAVSGVLFFLRRQGESEEEWEEEPNEELEPE